MWHITRLSFWVADPAKWYAHHTLHIRFHDSRIIWNAHYSAYISYMTDRPSSHFSSCRMMRSSYVVIHASYKWNIPSHIMYVYKYIAHHASCKTRHKVTYNSVPVILCDFIQSATASLSSSFDVKRYKKDKWLIYQSLAKKKPALRAALL